MMAEAKMESRSYSLHEDLISDILLRLPARSVARFRCVAKSWLSITTDRNFLRAHTSRALNSLLIHSTNQYSDDSDHRQIKLHLLSSAVGGGHGIAATLLSATRFSTTDVVFASCDGLVCLRNKLRERLEESDAPCYYVLNPLTGAQISVSKSHCSLGRLMGLYFHPPTGEYRLVRRLNSNSGSGLDKVELLTLGSEEWRQIEDSPGDSVCTRTPVDLNQALYWIAYNSAEFKACGVLRFDIMAEKFMLMPLPVGEKHLYANSSLFEIGGRLGLSIIDRELSYVNVLGIDIWVAKENEVIDWNKMYSLRCSSRFERIDFRFGYWVDDIALCMSEEELMVLLVGPRSYLVQFDLKCMKYYTKQVLDPDELMWHFTLVYKESLVSHDSFYNR